METLKAIEKRRSVRNFKPDKLSDEILQKIISAGQIAAIGKAEYDNIQMSVITNNDVIEKIDKTASDAAGRTSGGIYYHAPCVIVLSSGPITFPGIDYANAACVINNIMLAATDLGLGSLFVFRGTPAFTADPSLKSEINIPDNFEVRGSVAIGYASEEVTSPRRGRVRTEIID